jgi:hypothetical protein
MLPKIVWIADVTGWAYDNRARAIAAQLPEYEHHVVYNPVKHYADALPVLLTADLVVCPDPRLLPLLVGVRPIVQHVNAIKIFKRHDHDPEC